MILLPNPPGTDKYLANSATPIFMPSCPVVVVKSNFILNTREIYTEGTDLNGFILNDFTINARCLKVCNTKCGGNLCNQQKCACYQMPNRSSNVISAVEVTVTTPDGNLCHKNQKQMVSRDIHFEFATPEWNLRSIF